MSVVDYVMDKMMCMPIFGHTFLEANRTTIMYRLDLQVVSNPSFDALFDF